ncbi:MAG: hypothetical protein A3K61_02125 [Thaumarchaeota archaeon RBG_16_49_8]|nr:MAG: hypothetical protein A3K61_02125 [Thaumarchaeota archaeon RBG_16_49_8]
MRIVNPSFFGHNCSAKATEKLDAYFEVRNFPANWHISPSYDKSRIENDVKRLQVVKDHELSNSCYFVILYDADTCSQEKKCCDFLNRIMEQYPVMSLVSDPDNNKLSIWKLK